MQTPEISPPKQLNVGTSFILPVDSRKYLDNGWIENNILMVILILRHLDLWHINDQIITTLSTNVENEGSFIFIHSNYKQNENIIARSRSFQPGRIYTVPWPCILMTDK